MKQFWLVAGFLVLMLGGVYICTLGVPFVRVDASQLENPSDLWFSILIGAGIIAVGAIMILASIGFANAASGSIIGLFTRRNEGDSSV